MSAAIKLDRDRIRELFDLRRRGGGSFGAYTDDPYPALHRLRETGPVHEGTVHGLIGFDGPAFFHGLPEPDRPHYSVFSFEVCDAVYRDDTTFRSAPTGAGRVGVAASMLGMNGAEHRRHRSLVQPSFVPNKAKWWVERWINETVHGLIDGFEADGKAELNIDFDAAIPVLTITGSFGLSVDQALDVRAAIEGADAASRLTDYLVPIVRARRDEPQDDLISVLCDAELVDEDGERHRLSDDEIVSFSHLLLLAGSGTTWKQMGTTLAALLTTPGALDAVREDRSLLRLAVEESVRWCPTDPMFSRWAASGTSLAGVDIPAGAVVHICLGAANRDPARWDDPDTYDLHRPLQTALGFGGGPHICLGMHVARAEMLTAIGALIDRLPNLRLDPGAPPPQIIGLYERGPTEINVVWD
ncbi:MAG TPA: cytochrome P450 [Acidimicrobiales bacterium]|nr:cytochrome P450 [Acidimicrobiales bacterium]